MFENYIEIYSLLFTMGAFYIALLTYKAQVCANLLILFKELAVEIHREKHQNNGAIRMHPPLNEHLGPIPVNEKIDLLLDKFANSFELLFPDEEKLRRSFIFAILTNSEPIEPLAQKIEDLLKKRVRARLLKM